MRLTELTLVDFGPFRGRCTLPLGSGGPGTVVLVGARNGAGKTTLLDAVRFGFHGQRARGAARPLHSYVSDASAGGETGIILSFTHTTANRSMQIQVTRRWRIAPTGVLVESLEVRADGDRDAAMTEGWPMVSEELLPVALAPLFWVDGESIRSSSTPINGSPGLTSSLRNLLGLSLVDQLEADMRTIVDRQKAPHRSGQGVALTAWDAERSALQRELSAFADVRADLEQKVREVEQRIQDLLEPKRALHSDHPVEPQMEARIDQIKQEIEEERSLLLELCAGVLPLGALGALLARVMESAGAELTHVKGAERRHLLEVRDRAFLVALKAHRKGALLLEWAADWLQNDREATAGNAPVESSLGVDEGIHTRVTHIVNEQLPLVRDQAIGGLDQLHAKREEVMSLQARIDAIQRVKLDPTDQTVMEDLRAELRAHRATLSAIQRQEEDALQRQRALGAALASKVNALAVSHLDERRDVHVRTSVSRVHEVLGRYRDSLLRERLGSIEREMQNRIDLLAQKEGLVSSIRIDPVAFDVQLMAGVGDLIDFRRLSAGEQQILTMGCLWGLLKASGRTIPVIMDTPLGRMDLEHRNRLIKDFFPHVSQQTILLSTDTEIDQAAFHTLSSMGAIAATFRLDYDMASRSAAIHEGYFWSNG